MAAVLISNASPRAFSQLVRLRTVVWCFSCQLTKAALPATTVTPNIHSLPPVWRVRPMAGTDGNGEPGLEGVKPGAVTFGGLVLDRKRMEEERLARLKRRRDDNGDSAKSAPAHQKARHDSYERKKIDMSSVVVDITEADLGLPSKQANGTAQKEPTAMASLPPASAAVLSSSQSQPQNSRSKDGSSNNKTRTAEVQALPFLDGVVRRTWAKGYPRQSDDVRLDEILERDKLELAVISSFQWDEEWLLRQLDLTRTRLMLVAYAPDQHTKAAMKANAPPNTRFCFPEMGGWGYMHSKLQLLKFPGHLRIVVPTGNMVPYDWGETGVMENMVFIIDLPRLDNPDSFIPTDFSIELSRFLTAQKLDENLVHSLSNYDFSRTGDLAFVHTISGKHEGDDWKHTGHPGLGTAVKALGLATENSVEVECVVSRFDKVYLCSGSALADNVQRTASMGSLTDKFLLNMYLACQGTTGTPPSRKTPSRATTSATAESPVEEHLRIYFPSKETVEQSRGGTRSAGTICFSSKWWESPTFPRQVLRDSTSTRPGLLLHTKAILVRPSTGSPGQCWAYVGSSNLSESAWGKLVKDRKTGKERLDCRNWECGVVIPANQRKPAISAQIHTSEPTDTTPGTDEVVNVDDAQTKWTAAFADIALPLRFPGRRYAETGPGSHPWFFHD